MESPSSGTSSLLSYDRSSLKLDSNFQTVCGGGANSDSVSVSSAPGNNVFLIPPPLPVVPLVQFSVCLLTP